MPSVVCAPCGGQYDWREARRGLTIQASCRPEDTWLLLLRDERKRYSAAFGTLIAARQNAVSAASGYFDQRDVLNHKIQAKIAAERQECF